MRKRFASLLCLGLMGGCISTYEDVSKTPEFSDRVGQICTISIPLIAHGISKELGSAKKTDYFSITSRPGFNGPEVTSRETVPAGSTLTIVGAKRCTNCLRTDVKYLVTTSALPALRAREALAPAEVLTAGTSSCRKT